MRTSPNFTFEKACKALWLVNKRGWTQTQTAGPYLLRFAQEASWREDNRRVTNGEQVHRIAGLAMQRKPSVDFCGYWQRHTGQTQ